MKKCFKSSLEEATDVHYRLGELAGTLKQQKWVGLILTPIPAILHYYLRPKSSENTIFAIIIVVICIVVYLMTYKRLFRMQVRELVIKTQGKEPVDCEYELTDESLIFRKQGQEFRFGWQTIKEVRETLEGMELIMQPMGISIIRRTIFETGAEFEEWKKFIQSKIQGTTSMGGRTSR
jgi:hypothetical protein